MRWALAAICALTSCAAFPRSTSDNLSDRLVAALVRVELGYDQCRPIQYAEVVNGMHGSETSCFQMTSPVESLDWCSLPEATRNDIATFGRNSFLHIRANVARCASDANSVQARSITGYVSSYVRDRTSTERGADGLTPTARLLNDRWPGFAILWSRCEQDARRVRLRRTQPPLLSAGEALLCAEMDTSWRREFLGLYWPELE